MAFDDWNHYGGIETEESLAVNDTRVKNGLTALEINLESPNVPGAHIWAQSEADAPTDAQIVTWANPNYGALDDDMLLSAAFRFQDINNYYAVSVDVGTAAAITLGLVEGGVATRIANIQLGDEFTEWNGVTLSDGANPIDNWNLWRLTLWVDTANNDIRARVEEDADEDGSWTQIGSDLVHTSVALSGGGVGLAAPHNGATATLVDRYQTWYDDTEVRY